MTPATFRFVAQCLNQLRHRVPNETNPYLFECVELSYYDKTRNTIVHILWYGKMKLGKTQRIIVHSSITAFCYSKEIKSETRVLKLEWNTEHRFYTFTYIWPSFGQIMSLVFDSPSSRWLSSPVSSFFFGFYLYFFKNFNFWQKSVM
jgi:hypothetical protein